jgi:hypothetical protein
MGRRLGVYHIKHYKSHAPDLPIKYPWEIGHPSFGDGPRLYTFEQVIKRLCDLAAGKQDGDEPKHY